jgi:LysR family transcriptional regulator, transcriptional activator for aaeXAB operon
MDNLHWELSVLSKAIHYKNLSGAAAHVGLSQPQLSRIISRLEGELGVVLLDRTARRKSGWTPVAFKIAETYFQSSRKLTQTLQQLTTDDTITHLTIGILEGLISLANNFCHDIFENSKIQTVELNVYDLSELEEHFEKNEIDLVFTCREPGKHKYKYVRNLGYQIIDQEGSGKGPRIFSQFEYANHFHARQGKRALAKEAAADGLRRPSLISNSLAVRKIWIEEHGGSGYVPSEVRRKKLGDEDVPVYLIASDLMNPTLWQKFEQFRL